MYLRSDFKFQFFLTYKVVFLPQPDHWNTTSDFISWEGTLSGDPKYAFSNMLVSFGASSGDHLLSTINSKYSNILVRELFDNICYFGFANIIYL